MAAAAAAWERRALRRPSVAGAAACGITAHVPAQLSGPINCRFRFGPGRVSDKGRRRNPPRDLPRARRRRRRAGGRREPVRFTRKTRRRAVRGRRREIGRKREYRDSSFRFGPCVGRPRRIRFPSGINRKRTRPRDYAKYNISPSAFAVLDTSGRGGVADANAEPGL